MADRAINPATTITWIATDELVLDERNPRLQRRGEGTPQEQILSTLWDEFSVDEIALSIVANGFFEYEPLFVAVEDGRNVVIEGNRRLAAVRLLRSASLRRTVGATDLPSIKHAEAKKLGELPVILTERKDSWRYLGFKHVNGPRAWESYAKAEYIAWVRNELNVPLDDIADTIGDRHTTVHRLYRALMVLRQAETAGVYTPEDRTKSHFSFSHLYTGLNYTGFQKYLGIASDKTDTKAPVAKSKLPELGDLLTWIYGSQSKNRAPLVRSQNPDLRILDEVLQSKDGVAALRQGLPLRVSHEISKGDETLFRESIVAAKHALQQVRAKMVTGYNGEVDLMEDADDILRLAESIHEEMAGSVAKRGSRSRARAGR